MLTSLQIENVAVIEKANVQFEMGLNVLTGETGAGKSILIDSINAILGNRTSRDLVRTGAQKAVIRAAFEALPVQVLDKLEQAGYAREEALLLTREIHKDGKSSCRINGMPATATVLRDISSGLVAIHGQHDSVGLTNPAKHEGVLDIYAQNQAEYRDYYALYRDLIKVKRELDSLITDESEKQRKLDLLQYQVDEIDAAALQDGEEELLEARRKVLASAADIREKLMHAYAVLSDLGEVQSGCDLLGEASNALEFAAELDESLQENASKVSELYYAAKEIAADLASQMNDYESNDAELDEIEERLDYIYKLKRKYGNTIAQILSFGEDSRAELNRIQFSEQHAAELETEKRRLYQCAREKAETLTQTRLVAFADLNTKITGALAFLNMPGVCLTLKHVRGPLSSHGQDSIEFYISSNPGEEPKPMAKIASGGELSRITLAIKSAMADKDEVPTIIYDEIDTGVSGKAAGKIGKTLKSSAKNHQILCITHTAQIAAEADSHLLIQKNIENERTFTEIRPLNQEERVNALASIISGDQVTALSLENAREMLGLKQ
ncbi:MAG: DNA repair protein RecN [Faecalibacterium sp.]